MPIITQESIRRVKENVGIDDVFEWLGAKVVRRNRSTMAFCPFCDDAKSRNPACSLDVSDGLYHCFRCGNSGDSITAVMEHESCSFVEAVEALSKQFKIPLQYEKARDPEAESRRRRQVSVLTDAQDMFLEQRDDPQWQKFVSDRNISQEAYDKFELGLSLYAKADEVIARLLEKHSRDDIIGSGIAYERDDRKLVLRFKNRITYPIRTAPGTLIGFGGRDITGKSKAKYVNSPESELFKKRAVLYGINKAKRAMSVQKQVIVCEGYMDTIALSTHGYENTVGAMGTALTTQNLKYLANFCDTIYISLDADDAGVKAAMRTVDNLPPKISSDVRVVSIPLSVAKDPDEFFNKQSRTADDFAHLMENADDIYMFCVKHLVSDDVLAIDAEFSEPQPNQVAVNRLRSEIKTKAGDFMSRHYREMDTYHRNAIAAWLIDSGRLLDYAGTLDDEWRRGNTFRRVDENDVSGFDAPTLGTFANERTVVEDILLGTLYYHPEVREEIKRNIADIELMFTSETRRSIFDKLCDGLSRKETPEDIRLGFDGNETRECARILTSQAVENAKNDLGAGAVAKLCLDIQKTNLEHMIEFESGSADPDIGRILELKMSLANILERLSAIE